MKRIIVILSLLIFATISDASAITLLFAEAQPNSYVNGGGTPIGLDGWGYGKPYHSNFTSLANSVIGQNNISVASNFEDYNLMRQYDAIWVDIRDYSDTLSSLEFQNIQRFASTGKKVVLMGDGSGWGVWDTSLLSTVDSTLAGFYYGATLTPIINNEITQGIDYMDVWSGAVAEGGTALFNANVVSLWGDESNVLTILDEGMFDNHGWSQGYNNPKFAENTLSWVKNSSANPVPEPTTILLFGSGIFGLALRKRLHSKKMV